MCAVRGAVSQKYTHPICRPASEPAGQQVSRGTHTLRNRGHPLGQKEASSSLSQQEEEEEAVEEEKEKQSGWKDGRREGWKQFEEVVRSG